MDDTSHKEREHFFGAAKVIAGLTVLSRVVGMLREMTIIWLGASWQNEAFQFAFVVPNLFRRLFGEGALSAAFVPVFTDTTEKEGFDRARHLLANAMGLLAVFLLGLLVVAIAALQVWVWVAPPQADRALLAWLTSIMLPYMVLVCLLALASAAMNCRGHFIYPAFAPIVLSLCMIVASYVADGFWRGNLTAEFTCISVSVVVAGVIQLAGALWLLRRSGFPVGFRLRPVDPGVRRMLVLMGPTVLAIGLLQLSSLFDYVVAWVFTDRGFGQTLWLLGWQIPRPLTEGVLVRVVAAQRLYQLPMGVFAISLGVAVFPLLARYASRGDMPNLRDSLNRALRLATMEGLVTGTGLFVLAGPIMVSIYGHGKFGVANALAAATILQMYVLGMWSYCTYQIVTRAFYSLQDMRTPRWIACRVAVLYMAVLLGLIWIPGLGERAFGLTPAITFTLNVVVLLVILRRRVGLIGGRRLVISAIRSAAACAVMAAAVLAARWAMEHFAPDWLAALPSGGGWWVADWLLRAARWLLGRGLDVAIVIVGMVVGAAAFLATAMLLRAPELGELRGVMRERKGAKQDAKAMVKV